MAEKQTVKISLRPLALPAVSPQDLVFLRQVYASTRVDELALTDWPAAQKEAFIDQQFSAQHQYYLAQYPGAVFYAIEVNGQPAGRLYLHRRLDEIRIMDITLLPDFRAQGAGTRLMQDIQTEGQRTGRKVTIHVERFNPARHLYERLNFQLLEDRGVYLFLGWQPLYKEP